MSWNVEWKNNLKNIIKNGTIVSRKDHKRDILEIMSYKFVSKDPIDRLIFDTKVNLNIFQCIGQFLWITQGNFKLADISYYQPKSEKFSSDGVRMIGAYGPRLFGIAHLNQIQHIIDVLKEDFGKRKAVASIYLPQFDQHKLNNEEVPCTLNLQYLIRNDKLYAITYMRSQDAYKILPYDFFIFTMLQEYLYNILKVDYQESQIIKSDYIQNTNGGSKNANAGYKNGTNCNELKLGEYHHYSGSFHIYNSDLNYVKEIIENSSQDSEVKMPHMPSNDVELRLKFLNEFETTVRTLTIMKDPYNLSLKLKPFLEQIDKHLKERYWKQFAYLLLIYSILKTNDTKNFQCVYDKLYKDYKKFVDQYIHRHDLSNFYKLVE